MRYALVHNEEIAQRTNGELAEDLAVVSEDELVWEKLDLPWIEDSDLHIGCQAKIKLEQIEDCIDRALDGLEVFVVGLLEEAEFNKGVDFKASVYVFVELPADAPKEVLAQCAPDSNILMVDAINTGYEFTPGKEIILKSWFDNDHDLRNQKATIRYVKTQMEVEGW